MEMPLEFARQSARVNGRGRRFVIHTLCDEVERNRKALTAMREERDNLHAALRDVLARFSEPGHPGRDCLRTGWTPVEQVEAWRALVAGEAPDAR